MDENKQPGIKLLAVVVVEATMKLNGVIEPKMLDGEYEILLGVGQAFPSETTLDSLLEVQCKNKKHIDAIELRVKIIGKFESDSENIKTFAPNSATILFPYARQIIQTMTGWAPMSTLILPLMNVSEKGLKTLQQTP